MYKFTFFFFLILSSSLFSQNITNTLGNAGTFTVKNNVSTDLLNVSGSGTTVTGNATVTGNVIVGNSGQSYVMPTNRGTANQILQTNGAGSTSWTNAPPATVSIKYLICVMGIFPGGDITEHVIGEIILFAGISNFIPSNFMECKGQTLPISGNEALFAVIGTTYGGNGSTTFMLPNLTGKVVVGQ